MRFSHSWRLRSGTIWNDLAEIPKWLLCRRRLHVSTVEIEGKSCSLFDTFLSHSKRYAFDDRSHQPCLIYVVHTGYMTIIQWHDFSLIYFFQYSDNLIVCRLNLFKPQQESHWVCSMHWHADILIAFLPIWCMANRKSNAIESLMPLSK